MPLDEQEAQRLHEAPKVLDDDWIWEWTGVKFQGSAPVRLREEDTSLRLVGWNNIYRYSFSLLYRSNYVIRRWGFAHTHTDPELGEVTEPHKHFYTEEHGHDRVYITDDVSTSDVHEAFMDFLDEESIEPKGHYQPSLSKYE